VVVAVYDCRVLHFHLKDKWLSLPIVTLTFLLISAVLRFVLFLDPEAYWFYSNSFRAGFSTLHFPFFLLCMSVDWFLLAGDPRSEISRPVERNKKITDSLCCCDHQYHPTRDYRQYPSRSRFNIRCLDYLHHQLLFTGAVGRIFVFTHRWYQNFDHSAQRNINGCQT